MFTLSNSQLKFISDVLVAMSQISVGSMVLEYFVKNLNPSFLIFGIIMSLACWIFGLFINKKQIN